MILQRTSAAGVRPVSLAAAKEHLRVTHTLEDGLITGLIGAACDLVGEMSGRVLSLETWKASGNDFCGTVKLPKSPVIAVTGISYFDTAGDAQTANVSDFNTIASDDWTSIAPKVGKTWPAYDAARENGCSITFTAGYTTLPDALRMAVLLLVGHYFVNREAVGQPQAELPLAVESLVSAYRLGWVAG